MWPGGSQGESDAQLENRLAKRLKAAPHLIIIDNLETTAHVDYFASKLLAFTEPTRFLLTSRARPSGETAVYSHTLHELPFTDAEALLRHHAHLIGLTELAEADTDTMQAIYQVTGGNPLALKLVVSLTAVLPLPQILTDLNKNRAGPIEEFIPTHLLGNMANPNPRCPNLAASHAPGRQFRRTSRANASIQRPGC